MMKQPADSFRRFVGLYTLHQVEYVAAPEMIILRVRIETLRYAFAPLTRLPLQPVYDDDPRAGVELVRSAVAPRLHTLLDTRDPFQALGLLDADSDHAQHWQQYATARNLPAVVRSAPPASPVIEMPSMPRQLPARSPISHKLARAQQALELFQTAANTASTLAALWQNWQIGRERRQLLAAQRELLHDAIQAQLHGQDRALDRALDGTFVRGYLAEHTGDSGYTSLFENGSHSPE